MGVLEGFQGCGEIGEGVVAGVVVIVFRVGEDLGQGEFDDSEGGGIAKVGTYLLER